MSYQTICFIRSRRPGFQDVTKNHSQVLHQKFQYIQVFPQPAFTCLKLTIEALEQGVKYVQN